LRNQEIFVGIFKSSKPSHLNTVDLPLHYYISHY